MTKSWLDYQRFAVWGMGASGKAAANLLARRGKEVTVSDIRSEEELASDAKELEDGVDWAGGENVIGDAQVIVTSPGLRPGLAIFERARQQGIFVISEVELAFAASNARWVAITGTDGKTTTTSLVGSMLDAAGLEHVVAGNIGTALCDVVEKISPEAVVVAEISANQLWSCHRLAVYTAAITNIAEDHVDYFDDFREYPKAKHRLVQLQQPGAHTVLPASDDALREALANDNNTEITYFGLHREELGDAESAVFFEDGVGRWKSDGGEGQWLDDAARLSLMGRHNQLNVACAAAIARTVGASWEAIASGAVEFSALPHRMERVTDVDGVVYIDDSKATNAHASLAGLRGIDIEGSLIVIAGGRDKGLELEQWAEDVARRAQTVLLIGEITERMSHMLCDHDATVESLGSLEAAVVRAQELARPGSTVVLSPACSSYDMFSSYKERGRLFQQAVRALKPA